MWLEWLTRILGASARHDELQSGKLVSLTEERRNGENAGAVPLAHAAETTATAQRANPDAD